MFVSFFMIVMLFPLVTFPIRFLTHIFIWVSEKEIIFLFIYLQSKLIPVNLRIYDFMGFNVFDNFLNSTNLNRWDVRLTDWKSRTRYPNVLMLLLLLNKAVDEPTGQLKNNWTLNVCNIIHGIAYKINQKRVD